MLSPPPALGPFFQITHEKTLRVSVFTVLVNAGSFTWKELQWSSIVYSLCFVSLSFTELGIGKWPVSWSCLLCCTKRSTIGSWQRWTAKEDNSLEGIGEILRRQLSFPFPCFSCSWFPVTVIVSTSWVFVVMRSCITWFPQFHPGKVA